MFLGYDFNFWLSVGFATVIKFLLGAPSPLWKSFVTGLVGVWAAWTFTKPFLDFWGWESETYLVATAAVLAILGENLIRTITDVTRDPSRLAQFLRTLRGQNGK